MFFICMSIVAGICLTGAWIRGRIHKILRKNEEKQYHSLPVSLEHHQNFGFAGNRCTSRPEVVKWVGCAVLSVIVCLFVLLLFTKGKRGIKIGVSLLVGGGLSNLLERFLHGYVTDYLRFRTPFPWLNRWIFNLADFCIFIGCGILILASCMKEL